MSQEGSNYYVPAPSTWPMTGSIALFFMGFGAAFSVNKMPVGYAMLTLGFAILFYMLFGWFRTVARESESGKFNK
ncbi:cytochrome c oxidase subunit 3, partial [Nitrosospira sp. Nsp1]|uniref:cytochrome c oxidase subunit 3 n=2 Tax=unclassified Nitrosospira TaxID=2609267 RepID=UPI00088F00F9